MSSSKTTQRQTAIVSSFCSSTQPPEQALFAPRSSSYCPSALITEVNSTYDYAAHRKRHQKRNKEDGRWFPTSKPRYNSEWRKLKQGSSYPYPSHENRLPFAKMMAEDERNAEGREIIWEGGKSHRRHDGRRTNLLKSSGNKIGEKGKGKASETAVEHEQSTREEEIDTLWRNPSLGRSQLDVELASPMPWSDTSTGVPGRNRGSKRDSNTKSTTTPRQATYQRLHDDNCASQKLQQTLQGYLIGVQEWISEDDDENIEYLQSTEHAVSGIPFLDEPIDATIHFADHPQVFAFAQRDSRDPLMGASNLFSRFHHDSETGVIGMQTAPVGLQFPAPRLFPNLDLNMPMPSTDRQSAENLMMPAIYYPWSLFAAASGSEVPPYLSKFVAEMKRFDLLPAGFSRSYAGDNGNNYEALSMEHEQIMRELSILNELQGLLLSLMETRDTQHWRGQSDLRIMALVDHYNLRTYRGMFLERLDAIRYEMRNLSGIDEELDMDHLSLEEEEDEQSRRFASGHAQNTYHYDLHTLQHNSPEDFRGNYNQEDTKAMRKEARLQLEEYNNHWDSILSRPPNTPSNSTALANPIKVPYPPTLPLSTVSSSYSSSSATQAWTAHAFFCHAFNLTAYLEPPPPNSPLSPPKLAFYATGPREIQIRDLIGLRIQLKMEKVRWHEDRLRVVFGNAAATDERAKAVWAVVVDLKRGVDEALEELEDLERG